MFWIATEPARLSVESRELAANPANELVFSAASLWEIAIKWALGRGSFRVDPYLFRRGLCDNDYRELPITSEHAVAVAALPAIHADPFDRILVAQALVEGILLLTSDPAVARYPSPIGKV